MTKGGYKCEIVMNHECYCSFCFIVRLKLELEHCVRAMRDSEVKREELHEGSDKEEECEEVLRRAVEEREMMTQLAMIRMADRIKILEQENSEVKGLVRIMEDQISIQEQKDDDVIAEADDAGQDMDVANHEIVLTER